VPEIPLATLFFQVQAEDHLAVSTLWSKMNELLAGPPEDFDMFVRQVRASTQICQVTC
jgi:hypothetical protein